MIDVIRAGRLTSVQDLGRHGYRHLGIAMGGALDRLALEVGNRLVGNRPDAAGLEITFGPTVLRFPRATRVAITGGEFGATLDGTPVYSWWSVPVQAGQLLALNAAKRGMRCYVCVAGGIDVVPVLGSRSTDLGACFGGLGGRALRDGDRLPIGVAAGAPREVTANGTTGVRTGETTGETTGAPATRPRGLSLDAPAFGVKSPAWCKFVLVDEPVRRGRHASGAASEMPVRVLPGPDYDRFSDAAHRAFWSDEWRVTPNSNRMGYRLAGSALERNETIDLLSHAVMPGTIQVPPNGQPIVLMSDAQTTGGYPKIGSVIYADLWKLAQIRLNGAVRFVPTTPHEARVALLEERQYLQQIDAAIALHEERRAREMPVPEP
ncbi:biotin-dependent carboxyltransferase family protein [Paraburkholderia sp. SARCC-3016]|uniref:5-oxoprolinase subunit C family protein n=1 Tax=Paraburkholderia sp. SARCC-3016 TaxID=3058611 RepID=UPI0028089CA6|nr:biotin-dependent carboxyltransferase family protein [Paraburkholderia sp. SARCC-3016]MDQ7980812.1 biotin-dependent carboxyltransferase family protein [Paraburkholderia sp. SARCC-3016]